MCRTATDVGSQGRVLMSPRQGAPVSCAKRAPVGTATAVADFLLQTSLTVVPPGARLRVGGCQPACRSAAAAALGRRIVKCL